MAWLVTGGCGFLGTALVDTLLKTGVTNIRIVDNLQVGTRQDLAAVTGFTEPTCFDGPPKDVELIVGDIQDEKLAFETCRGCEVIVHFAANTGVGPSVQDPRRDCLVNVLGTFNYLEAARHNQASRFVFASSGAPVGEVIPPIHEEIAPHPVSPYGASKLAGEGYCSAYFRSYGLETVALRFGNVYGPGSFHKSSVVAKFIGRALSGLPLEIFGDGQQTRDFVFVDDLIDAVLRAATTPGIGGETFQIATGAETTLRELTSKLVETLNCAGVSGVRVLNTDQRLGDVRRNYADTSKAASKLGWRVRTRLDEGLKATVSYFMEKGLS
jgi:UDP-glucose 4-epimerase